MEQMFITAAQAARLMNVSSRTIRRMVCADKLCAETVSSDEGRGGLSYRIPLDALPAEAQIRYLEQIGRAERSERGCTEAFDLEAYKAHYGAAGVEKLLERQKAVLRLRGLRQALEEDLTGAVNALAAEYGMEEVKLDDDQLRGEIDDAAFELAGSYQYDGMHRGFELACRLFGEMLGEMLRGGARA